MMIHEVTEKAGAHRRRKRVGRGPGSGHGKTCGRGHKGAGSRSGFSRKPGYEGGQVPFFARLRQVGFNNSRFRIEYHTINVQTLESRFADGDQVTPDGLVHAGLMSNTRKPVKILGQGELTKKLHVTAATFSDTAKEKIEKAGGSVTATGVGKPKSGKPGKSRVSSGSESA